MWLVGLELLPCNLNMASLATMRLMAALFRSQRKIQRHTATPQTAERAATI